MTCTRVSQRTLTLLSWVHHCHQHRSAGKAYSELHHPQAFRPSPQEPHLLPSDPSSCLVYSTCLRVELQLVQRLRIQDVTMLHTDTHIHSTSHNNSATHCNVKQYMWQMGGTCTLYKVQASLPASSKRAILWTSLELTELVDSKDSHWMALCFCSLSSTCKAAWCNMQTQLYWALCHCWKA